ncbi:patatin-like phospholipase family protein [Calorimonas adulescens]|jgi:Patatin-like phospholipase.|uniref:Patatin-like phospholipase family protein n=1 Tax=Calorimonas adulescens TaxID=2606906 RepID=A0A5D8QC06_9THEO|nr:patatin-like phospholipase family protein [Calorimonas adulescens]TZE81336.1 patatin-like phospholipase family protein [Calorimonas adulescens]
MCSKTALVLGGGGARGYAHIGVIKALEEAGIQIDMIVGTSIGAIVGAGYASGLTVEEMESIAESMTLKKFIELMDISVSSQGLIKGNGISSFLNQAIKKKNFDELDIPFYAVATNILTGEKIVINQGDLIDAVRASMAIPGLFTPIRYYDKILVDGTLVDFLPINVAIQNGANRVIAVNVSSEVDGVSTINRIYISLRRALDKVEVAAIPENFRGVLKKYPNAIYFTIKALEILNTCKQDISLAPNVVVLTPPVQNIKWYNFQKAKEGIEAGYTTAVELINRGFMQT